MSITTCQKVTLISCSVLCISLFLPRMLLPRGKKEMGQPEGKAAYQIIIHPSISDVFFFVAAAAVVVTSCSDYTECVRPRAPFKCTHVHHNVTEWIRSKRKTCISYILKNMCMVCVLKCKKISPVFILAHLQVLKYVYAYVFIYIFLIDLDSRF